MIFISHIRKHWPAFILAILVGMTILLPTILSIEKLGKNNFKGIYPMLSDDEDHYLAEAREAYDGHLSMGNPYIKEYKTMPYTQPPLGAIFYDSVARLLHVSVPKAAEINDFLLPFFGVLMLYSFLYLLTKSKKISLGFSALFFISFLSTFNRPVNPQFSFIFLLAGLYFIWLIVENKHSAKKILIYNLSLAVIFGILVYVYPFYWMTIAVLYVLLTFSRALVEKDFRYLLKNWLCFLIPSFLFSIPFLLNAKRLVESPLFQEVNLRSGFISTHIPGSFVDVAIMFACLPAIYLINKLIKNKSWSDKKIVFLGLSMVQAGIILNWQNIITGKTIQFPEHLYPVGILFVCIICAVSFLYIDIKKLSRNSMLLLGLVFLMIVSVLYKQRGEIIYAFQIIHSPKDISSTQGLYPVMDWLNKNTPPDSAIYALGDNYSWAIPIYTGDNLYFNSNAGLSLMSDTELENRWLIQNFFEKVDKKYIQENERAVITNKFIETYQSEESRRKILQFITDKNYPESVFPDSSYIDKTFNAYNGFHLLGFENAIKTYSVDYIVLDKSYLPSANLPEKFKSYKSFTLLVQIGDTLIYKVN